MYDLDDSCALYIPAFCLYICVTGWLCYAIPAKVQIFAVLGLWRLGGTAASKRLQDAQVHALPDIKQYAPIEHLLVE